MATSLVARAFTKRIICAICACALVASLAVESVVAQAPPNSIGFSFFNPNDAATGPLFVGPANAPATNLAAGVAPVRQSFWNDLAGGPNMGSGTLNGLQDRFGSPTSLQVQWSGSDVSSQSYVPAGAPGAGDAQMMNGVLINALGSNVEIDVSQVPPSWQAVGFDVFVYADREFINNQESIRVEVGGSILGSLPVLDTKSDFAGAPPAPATFSDADYDDATVDGVGNFVRFDNLNAGSFKIVADAGGAITYITGVQLVAHPIPEPCSGALMIGVVMLAGATRRRSSSA